MVRGRRPLARDPSILMDYEVMSDQEWEEEPEGEDLSVRPPVQQTLGVPRVQCSRSGTSLGAPASKLQVLWYQRVAIGKEAR